MSEVTTPITNPTTLVDQDRVRWAGSGSVVPGHTPYGFYDSDSVFQSDAQASAIWAAYRLGYPIVDIEMLDVNFYAAFEEAVNEYAAQVNQMNIQNYLLTFQGQNISSLGNLTGKSVTVDNLSYIIDIGKSYGII